MAITDMECTHCKSAVPFNQALCPSCGKDPVSRTGKIIGYIGAAALFATIGFAVWPDAEVEKQSAQVAETPKETKETAQPVAEAPRPAIEVTAKELAKAYESNEVAAQLKYGDGPLKVTGKVTGIELDFLDNAVIQFASNNQFMPVQGTLKNKDESASLVKGQNATMQCETAAEVLGSPVLRKCTLVTQ